MILTPSGHAGGDKKPRRDAEPIEDVDKTDGPLGETAWEGFLTLER